MNRTTPSSRNIFLLLAKAMLLFPFRLFLGSLRKEEPGDARSGVFAASGPRGGVWVGRMGVIPSMMVMAMITIAVLLLLVAAGAAVIVLSPLILAVRLISRKSNPVLDGAIPVSGHVLPDEPDKNPGR